MKMKSILGVIGTFLFGCGTPETIAKVGDVFPEFNLKNHLGDVVRKQDILGSPSVIWFYPKASTPGWRKEGCGFRDEFEKYREAGINIYGVSFDSIEKNKEFAEDNQFPYFLLSDSKRQLAISLGIAKEEDDWFAPRVTFLVSPEGVIDEVIDVDSVASHANDLLNNWSISTPLETAMPSSSLEADSE